MCGDDVGCGGRRRGGGVCVVVVVVCVCVCVCVCVRIRMFRYSNDWGDSVLWQSLTIRCIYGWDACVFCVCMCVQASGSVGEGDASLP